MLSYRLSLKTIMTTTMVSVVVNAIILIVKLIRTMAFPSLVMYMVTVQIVFYILSRLTYFLILSIGSSDDWTNCSETPVTLINVLLLSTCYCT